MYLPSPNKQHLKEQQQAVTIYQNPNHTSDSSCFYEKEKLFAGPEPSERARLQAVEYYVQRVVSSLSSASCTLPQNTVASLIVPSVPAISFSSFPFAAPGSPLELPKTVVSSPGRKLCNVYKRLLYKDQL